MRFFRLLPVRDDRDIIGGCIQELLKWAAREKRIKRPAEALA